jgi:membrane protease YdiL (CAAX protease family)
VVEDFGLRFRPIDVAWALGTAFIMLVLAGGLGYLLTEALDVGSDESTNTEIISDAADTEAIWIIVIAAVVLAPLVEELFFRGLCLRAIEKRFGTTVAVVGSTILFTIPHFTNPSLAGTVVLFSVIGMVGLFLALLVVRTKRLGPAILAHAAFNAVGVIGVLAGS